MDNFRGQKRKRLNREPSPSRHAPEHSRNRGPERGRQSNGSKYWASSDQARINQLQDEERHREFLAQEGQFILRQKRKAAEIRVKEGRSRPMDWLTVNLRIIDPIMDLINDEIQEEDLDYYDPEAIIEGLSTSELSNVRKDIDEILELERSSSSRGYWRTMRILCQNRQQGVEGRAVRSVSADIDKLLGPKSYHELEKLEKQINKKLNSNEPIDTDYWQQLLDHLLVYKAKATLKEMYRQVLQKKSSSLRRENKVTAKQTRSQLSTAEVPALPSITSLDPEPLLNLDADSKSLTIIDEAKFLSEIASDRQRIIKSGYVPAAGAALNSRKSQSNPAGVSEPDNRTASSMFDREAAKGVEEDEEVFAGEEKVETRDTDSWKGQYRPRKPRYFNRVQMGYEWNKYNQTHYDHDNPPPKVVQGYKFHVFYPDLIDPAKAPTYKITREGGRKKGETVAPAGEEDTCIIRFMSGPPYEDIAFRIVDRDWDYSAKHDRGFKSTFENGILTLHFSFKKVHYRK